MGFAKVVVIGNLGRDVETRYTEQGVAVCNFSIASSARRGDKEETLWFKIEAWRGLAELAAKYLRKGSQAYVEGTLSVETWHSAEKGPQFGLKVTAKDIQFLGGRDYAIAIETAANSAQESEEVPGP